MGKYKPTHCKETVKKILTDYKDTRDSDEKLIARLWLAECVLFKLDYAKLLEHLFHCKLTTPTSIIRTRRLIQLNHAELRGEKYIKRVTRLENEAKQDIKNYGKK